MITIGIDSTETFETLLFISLLIFQSRKVIVVISNNTNKIYEVFYIIFVDISLNKKVLGNFGRNAKLYYQGHIQRGDRGARSSSLRDFNIRR